MTTPDKILEVLRQRKNFGHWWDNIRPEDQEEILEEMTRVLQPKPVETGTADTITIEVHRFVQGERISASRSMTVEALNHARTHADGDLYYVVGKLQGEINKRLIYQTPNAPPGPMPEDPIFPKNRPV